MFLLFSARDPWKDPSSQIIVFSFASYYSSCCDRVCSCITMGDSFPHPQSSVPPTPVPPPQLLSHSHPRSVSSHATNPLPISVPLHLWDSPAAETSKLPVGHLDGLFVGWGDQEADRRHHGLVPRGTDHLPLGPLGIVLQHTLVIPADGDLRRHQHHPAHQKRAAGLHMPALAASFPPGGEPASVNIFIFFFYYYF